MINKNDTLLQKERNNSTKNLKNIQEHKRDDLKKMTMITDQKKENKFKSFF